MAPYTPDLRRATPKISASTNGFSSAENHIHHNNNNNYQITSFSTSISNRISDDSQPSSSSNSSTTTTTQWRRVKCVLVGDAAVGKTSLIVSYTTDGYPQEYVPTAFDNYSVLVRVDNQPIKLQLCDTAGQEDFDSLRPLCYPNTDVFLLCFSIVSPTSFHNLRRRWLPELKHHAPGVPLILVGTECDLRTNIKVLLDLNRHQQTPVAETEARRFAEEIDAVQYLECSSLTQQNLKETFDAAILVALKLADDAKKNQQQQQQNVGKRVQMQEFCGRKSLRKLKEKLMTRSSSVDCMKNPTLNVKNGTTNLTGAASSGRLPMTNSFNSICRTQPQRNQPERYSTHSSASHFVVRQQQRKKKVSTASAPIVDHYGVNLNCNPDTALTGSLSDSPKLKKGWRRLLCVA